MISRLLKPAHIQTKLTVSNPGDASEREADRVADVVMRMPDPQLQRKPNRAVGPTREEGEDAKDLPRPADEEKRLIQTKSLAGQSLDQSPQLSATVAANLQAMQGSGSPLSHETRSFFEPRFGANFSQVRVHTNERAAQSASALSARAFTTNRDIVFGAGEYSPETHSGQRLLSHELAHVVQQGAGGSAGSIQRFEEGEHREIGDDATRGPHGETKTVQLASDYRITYGEMVAMAADHFQSIEQMRDFAGKPGPGPGTREEIEYIRVVKVHELKSREREFSEKARQAADRRYYTLAARNPSHFVNPESGDTNKSTAEKALAHHTEIINGVLREVPNNAVGFYRENHIRAIVEAWNAGKAAQSIDEAMAVEAFSNHYLTDSFSAGHNRTARTSATEYWNKKLPMFFENFKGFMAEKLAYWINDHNWRGVATVDLIWGRAKTALEKTLREKGIPDFTFGDLVSGAIHHYDNEKGIKVTVDGQPRIIFGDAHLHEGDTKDVAMKAVQASVVDVETAFTTGKANADFLSLVLKLVPRGMFRAEEMIPVPAPDSALAEPARAIKWDYATEFELLSDGKFREGLKIFLAAKKSELAGVGNGLEDEYQRDAFTNAIVNHMAGEEGINMIWSILQWTPNTGGGVGGHNQDDNALDYYNQAKRTKGGLASLMWSARANLIRSLIDGPTLGDEEDAILDLLVTCPSDSDVRSVIKYITWDRLEDEIGERFKKRYPKANYTK